MAKAEQSILIKRIGIVNSKPHRVMGRPRQLARFSRTLVSIILAACLSEKMNPRFASRRQRRRRRLAASHAVYIAYFSRDRRVYELSWGGNVILADFRVCLVCLTIFGMLDSDDQNSKGYLPYTT